jgi:hypothetical protein
MYESTVFALGTTVTLEFHSDPSAAAATKAFAWCVCSGTSATRSPRNVSAGSTTNGLGALIAGSSWSR